MAPPPPLPPPLPPPSFPRKINNRRAGFFNLPAEVRNRIYHMALLLPDEYEIWGKGATYEVRRRGTGTLTQIPLFEGALLHACRRANFEAAPVLYGSNRYAFWDSQFLRNIGGNVRFIRQVRLVHMTQKELSACLQILKWGAPLLDELQFGPFLFNSVGSNRIARLTGPFVRALHRRRRWTAAKSAMQVVVFVEPRDQPFVNYGGVRRNIRSARRIVSRSLFYAEDK